MTPLSLGFPDVLRTLGDLVGSAVLGGAIGAQRQAAHKPAGFRTHLLVALGSCGFVEVSRLTGDSRIAAGVVTGIGFLGAGAIMRSGEIPRGLTTAASIWVAAAVGMALGIGGTRALGLAVVVTILTFAALSISDEMLERFFPPRRGVQAWVTFEIDKLTLDRVAALFTSSSLSVRRSERLTYERVDGTNVVSWLLTLQVERGRDFREGVLEAGKTPGIRRIELTDVTPPP